jgi:AraC family transcriptional regulator
LNDKNSRATNVPFRYYEVKAKPMRNGRDGMNKILDYIENNITEKIETSELAKSVNYSAVQFTRNFIKATGYTPAQYVTKRKLYFSAWDLLNTNEKIIDIAMRYNFECHDTFSRAFKRFYGKTPEFF